MGNCVGFQISCDQVLNHACSCVFGDRNYILMMEGNLEVLQNSMQELEAKRADLLTRVTLEEDKGLQRRAEVKRWFTRVENVVSQVNDLLKARSAQTQRLCLCGYCSKSLISGCEYGKKLAKKLNEVQELLSKGDFERVAEKIPVPKVEEKHIQTTVGLDTIVESTWNHILTDGCRTLGLFGIGGVGRTLGLFGIGLFGMGLEADDLISRDDRRNSGGGGGGEVEPGRLLRKKTNVNESADESGDSVLINNDLLALEKKENQ